MIHTYTDRLGDIIKDTRQKPQRTLQDLAVSIGISERYLYRIENESKKPSFYILYKLIRELSIPSDLIFYPERPTKDSEIENLTDCSIPAMKALSKLSKQWQKP